MHRARRRGQAADGRAACPALECISAPHGFERSEPTASSGQRRLLRPAAESPSASSGRRPWAPRIAKLGSSTAARSPHDRAPPAVESRRVKIIEAGFLLLLARHARLKSRHRQLTSKLIGCSATCICGGYLLPLISPAAAVFHLPTNAPRFCHPTCGTQSADRFQSRVEAESPKASESEPGTFLTYMSAGSTTRAQHPI